jgi:uncharacterized protein with NRDE domain
MCLAVIDWDPTSKYPVKVVANRDEFRKRPALPMHWWDDAPILAGKDLEAGGSWLGFNQYGQFALLTNIRPGYVGKKGQLSRGDLVVNFLKSKQSISDFHQSMLSTIDQYGGFNLLLGNAEEVFWFSSTQTEGQWLSPGIHALSNDSLNTPWPKTTLAVEQMKQERGKLEHSLNEHGILSSQHQVEDKSLPTTGVPVEWERMLSAQTILGSEYGTRCRTHFILDRHQKIKVVEEQIDVNGVASNPISFVVNNIKSED